MKVYPDLHLCIIAQCKKYCRTIYNEILFTTYTYTVESDQNKEKLLPVKPHHIEQLAIGINAGTASKACVTPSPPVLPS